MTTALALIAFISIYALAAAAHLVRRFTRIKLCLVCAGVAGTWIWLLVARRLGIAVDPTIIASLIGGSVVGIAYQAAKRLPPNRSPVGWKLAAIPPGFVAAYGIVTDAPIVVGLGLAAALAAAAWFWRHPRHSATRSEIASLERDMKNCC